MQIKCVAQEVAVKHLWNRLAEEMDQNKVYKEAICVGVYALKSNLLACHK